MSLLCCCEDFVNESGTDEVFQTFMVRIFMFFESIYFLQKNNNKHKTMKTKVILLALILEKPQGKIALM